MLILCEVLRWKASEVAELLETSVASVNSALQRARATLEASEVSTTETPESVDAELLARYVEAFERYDMDALTSLISEDARQSMPPFDMWLSGREDIFSWWFGPGNGCRGSKVIPTVAANGSPAFAQYKPNEAGDGYEPWALQVLEIEDGKIVEFTFFLDTERVFPLFGVPLEYAGLAHSGKTSRKPMNSTSSSSSGDAWRTRTWHPQRLAASWSRQSASTVTASGSTPWTSQNAIPGLSALEERADAVAEAREVVPGDRTVDREGDRRRTHDHAHLGLGGGAGIHRSRRDEFGAGPGSDL